MCRRFGVCGACVNSAPQGTHESEPLIFCHLTRARPLMTLRLANGAVAHHHESLVHVDKGSDRGSEKKRELSKDRSQKKNTHT